MKIVTFSLGCKVNKYESDSILEDLKSKGFEISDKLEWADAYIINTCAVTSEAEKKSRQTIARCRKLNKDAKIYVCGCASQRDSSQFSGKGVEFVKGTAGKQKMKDELEKKGVEVDSLPLVYENMTFSHHFSTRAYLKIQDGCNNFCTYCIIPYLRGRSRSRAVEDILKEAQLLPDSVKEIVLVGINVSDFKIGGEEGLVVLLEKLDKLGKRIRLSSMEDGIIDENFIKRLSCLKNFCPHFHMSLQSGSEGVLKRMNRHYTPQEFKNSVELIRKYFPYAGITTDVIVGFPGETEKEFQETVDFAKDVKFSYLHIFKYSHRSGTVASRLEDLKPEVKKQRAISLEKTNKQLQKDFINLNLNQEESVLIEEKQGEYYIGHSKNFIKCFISAEGVNLQVGDVVLVKIEKQNVDAACACFAKIVKD